MARSGLSSVDVSGRAPGDGGRTVVWVRGVHDMSTRMSLAEALARAAKRDGGDLLVDLSGVTFMDASTAGVLVEAVNRLHSQQRSLAVRAPSAVALRLLALCDLTYLVSPEAGAPSRLAAAAPALGSWVAVPRTEPVGGGAGTAARPHPDDVPVDVRLPVTTEAEHERAGP